VKKFGFLVLSAVLSMHLHAGTTTTTTQFEDVAYNGIPITGQDNEYGDSISHKTGTIKTVDFKVDNFWDKFHKGGEAQSNYAQVSKVGIFELTTQATFACAKANLNAEGCSGQKPFLMNEGILSNPELTKEADGSDIVASDEYRIPFDDAANYLPTNVDAFYALDVDRNENFYKEPATPPAPGKKSFFSFIIDFLRDYYSKDQRVFGHTLTPEESAIRDRYVANIVYGHDQEHRLRKAYKGKAASSIDTTVPVVNKPVSLIDYEELFVTETSGCKTFFVNLDPDSLRCRAITGFGLANWIPFIDDKTTFDVESKSVMADTEATLLALSGELNNKNYVTPTLENAKNPSFFAEIFKPMTNMFGGMFRFFFGSKPPKTVEAISISFDFDKYLDLTFAMTDGDEVTGFKHFYLKALESVYGTEVESCTVKEVKGLFGWASDKATFVSGVPSNKDISFNDGFFNLTTIPSSKYNVLSDAGKIYKKGFWPFKYENLDMTTDDWLNWCKRNQGEREKGLFGKFFSKIGRMLSNPSTYETQIDNIAAAENFVVVEYKEKVHRGLILRLQEHEIKSGAAGTTTTYKLLNVK